MAGYRGHIAGAAALGIAYASAVDVTYASADSVWRIEGAKQIANAPQLLTTPEALAGMVVVSVLFGLWPDIDTNSKGQDLFYGIAFIADAVLVATRHLEVAAIFGLLAMTPILGKHRGWTHSLLAMFMVPAAVFALPLFYDSSLMQAASLIYGAAVVGYFSHLLLDGRIVKWIRVEG